MLEEVEAQGIGEEVMGMLLPNMTEEMTSNIGSCEIFPVGDDSTVVILLRADDSPAAKRLSTFFNESVQIQIGEKVYKIEFEVLEPGGMH